MTFQFNKTFSLLLISLLTLSCRKDTALPVTISTNNSNWSLQKYSSGALTIDAYAVEFFGNGTVIIGGKRNALYPAGTSIYSTDNGISWNAAYGSAEGTAILTIGIVNDSSAYIIADSFGQANLGYTNDYCQSFTTTPLGGICSPSFGETTIHFFNDSFGFIGNKRTEDGGQTWACNTLPPSVCYFFLNDSSGYACAGNDLLQTSDMGLTWSTIYSGTNNLRSVKFLDESNGLLLNGTQLFSSTDGGINWTLIKSEVSAFCFTDSQTFFITSGGEISKTTDSGDSWDLVFKTNKVDFLDIAKKGNTVIAVGKQLNINSDFDSFFAISNNP
jgi:photosystem II stability/assembly factor-like uncharacterized protein